MYVSYQPFEVLKESQKVQPSAMLMLFLQLTSPQQQQDEPPVDQLWEAGKNDHLSKEPRIFSLKICPKRHFQPPGAPKGLYFDLKYFPDLNFKAKTNVDAYFESLMYAD